MVNVLNWHLDMHFYDKNHIRCNYAVQSTCNGNLNICLTNFSKKWITLQKNSHVANIKSAVAEDELFEFEEAEPDDDYSLYNHADTQNDLPDVYEAEAWEDLIKIENPEVSEEMKGQLMGVLKDCKGVMPTKERPLGRCTMFKHKINTGEAQPITVRPIPYNPEKRELCNKHVKEMLSNNLISPAQSPWAFPCLLVKKKDGRMRVVADFRKLNDVTEKCYYPLPNIDDCLHSMEDSKWFTSLDCANAFWQLEMAQEDKKKATFCTQDGVWSYNVMPMGLCNASSSWQAVMHVILSGMQFTECLTFLDDCLIYSKTYEEHLVRLRKVLKAFENAGLTIKPEKCKWAENTVIFLGHKLSEKGIEPDMEKVQAVMEMKPPLDIKGVQRFLGSCGFYRQFILNYADKADPLNRLLKGEKKFIWSVDQQGAFQQLKDALVTHPILARFVPGCPTRIRTDASGIGVGAVLQQFQDGHWRPLAYASKTLNDTQRRLYTSSERELWAVIYGLKKFRQYLDSDFEVLTDHSALQWLRNLKDPVSRLGRWAVYLAQWKFKVVHKPGTQMADVDCLSRQPVEPPLEEDAASCDSLCCALESIQLSDILDDMSGVDWLRDKQTDDPFFQRIVELLEAKDPVYQGKEKYLVESFRLIKGILYKINKRKDLEVRRVCVPKAFRLKILEEAHDAKIGGGHSGVLHTWTKIQQRYYFPHMYHYTKEYVRTCAVCQKYKLDTSGKKGFLKPINPGGLFEKWGCDIVGPIPRSADGNSYLLVATEYKSRWVVAKAVRQATAYDLVEFMIDHIICPFGTPKLLITDRGTQYMSAKFVELCKVMGIRHVPTTAYSPWQDGLTESINKDLIQKICVYTNEKSKTWDEYVSAACLNHNTTKKEFTGYSPFYILFGQEARFPIDNIFQQPIELSEDTEEELDSYLQKRKEQYNYIKDILDGNMENRQQQNRQQYDKSRFEPAFRPGEFVLIREANPKKLQAKYFGPWKIVWQVSPVTYRVSRRKGKNIVIDTVNINRMKRFNVRDENIIEKPSGNESDFPAIDIPNISEEYVKDPDNSRLPDNIENDNSEELNSVFSEDTLIREDELLNIRNTEQTRAKRKVKLNPRYFDPKVYINSLLLLNNQSILH